MMTDWLPTTAATAPAFCTGPTYAGIAFVTPTFLSIVLIACWTSTLAGWRSLKPRPWGIAPEYVQSRRTGGWSEASCGASGVVKIDSWAGAASKAIRVSRAKVSENRITWGIGDNLSSAKHEVFRNHGC